MSFSSMERIANALNMTLAELFSGIEGPEAANPVNAPKRVNSQAHKEINRGRLVLELASLERSVKNLREILDVPNPDSRNESLHPVETQGLKKLPWNNRD